MKRTDKEMEELRERLIKEHLTAIAKQGVEVGKIFWHVDTPDSPWEIIRLAFVEGGSYWWAANFNSRELRLIKSSEIKDSSVYFTYFKTREECIIQRIKNLENSTRQEVEILEEEIKSQEGQL